MAPRPLSKLPGCLLASGAALVFPILCDPTVQLPGCKPRVLESRGHVLQCGPQLVLGTLRAGNLCPLMTENTHIPLTFFC